MRVIATRVFDRAAAKLLTRAERETAEAALVARPDAWPVIPGSGGARKARIARGGQGKRGGARVIYFYSPAPGLLALLALYAKNEKETLTHADLQAIRAAIAAIREAVRDDTAR